MSSTSYFSLPSKVSDRAVLETLRNHGPLKLEGRFKIQSIHLDTVDRRIERSGWSLQCERGDTPPLRLDLWRVGADQPVARLDTGRPPAWGWDLPRGPEWAKIRNAIGERRILECMIVSTRGERVAVLDSELKTVVRISLERHSIRVYSDEWNHQLRLIAVSPVRGYDKSRRAVSKVLAAAGFRQEKDLLTAMSSRRPARKAGDVMLDRSIPIAAAVSRVLGALREEMVASESGVRIQLDTEFLHEYRVAARCFRSILGQVSDLLPAESVRSLMQELRWLGTFTGPARDIDVHLLQLRDTGGDVEPLRRLLAQKREIAQEELVAVLDSDRYRNLLDAWHDLERRASAGTRSITGRRPAGPVADKYVRRAHRRVIKAGGKVDDASPPEALHDLRKKAKALRYLLETFQPLYPSSGWRVVVSELKALQDNLGEFQDCQVQAGELRNLEQELNEQGSLNDSTLDTVARMVGSLNERRESVRASFEARFKRFSSNEVSAKLESLYSGKHK